MVNWRGTDGAAATAPARIDVRYDTPPRMQPTPEPSPEVLNGPLAGVERLFSTAGDLHGTGRDEVERTGGGCARGSRDSETRQRPRRPRSGGGRGRRARATTTARRGGRVEGGAQHPRGVSWGWLRGGVRGGTAGAPAASQ
jgi:hypothetical protein